MVSLWEGKNDFNPHIPRYIDSQQAEDIQDIDARLRGGTPVADIDGLGRYWTSLTVDTRGQTRLISQTP